MGVSSVVIVGGVDMVQQAVAISKKPHILVCTPGRLQDHLENTKGFSLRSLKFLIMDEADRLLDLDFGPAIDKILKFIPHGRQTMLFSATMTSRVEKLQRASLVRPVRVAVSTKFQTVSTLLQSYIFIPFKYKDTYAVFLVKELTGNTLIIFARTCNDTERLTLLLRELGLPAVALHGQMNQSSRLAALGKFKDGDRSILVATDVAARGLDIPSVDCVLNYDIPTDSKSYIHRVGRTARAGRAGKSVSLVTQYDLELFLRIEAAIGKKMTERKTDKEKVMALVDRVNEAQRVVASAMKDKRLRRESKREGKHVSSSGKRQKRSH